MKNAMQKIHNEDVEKEMEIRRLKDEKKQKEYLEVLKRFDQKFPETTENADKNKQ